MGATELAGALRNLRSALESVRLPLPGPSVEQSRSQCRALLDQLDDYVLPRLANLDAPLLAVVGGSTGAGKSTLVNSLIGRVVSRAGVIRPTTTSPVLIFNPAEQGWFDDERILPGLARTTVSTTGTGSIQLVPEPSLPRDLALLDAPDIDSVSQANRRLAAQLLQAADLWLFVTSAARYADAVPWQFLTSAAERGAAVAVVCDRIPPAGMQLVPADLARLMSDRGLAESPLFAVPETLTDETGLLPDAAVAPIRTYLATLAADNQRRDAVIAQTLDGAVRAITEQSRELASALRGQADVLSQLRRDAESAFDEAARAVGVRSADGTLLRGEVLTRWQDYVGTSEFTRAIDNRISWLRDRLTSMIRGEPSQAVQASAAAGSGLEALIIEQGQAAAERAGIAWRANPAGREIIAAHPDLARVSEGFEERARGVIRDWQADVLQLVTEQGKGKRTQARLVAAGVNGVGAALMIVIFAHTAGLSGAEIGVAGGTTVVAQRLLESIFGDDAVRRLAKTAKEHLDTRVGELMASEAQRYQHLLADLAVDETMAARLDEAIAAVEAARAGRTPVPAELTAGDQAGRQLGGVPREAVEIQRVEADGVGAVIDAEIIDEAGERA
ncbi:P-loop NTPase family protein [Propionibacterium australiense]|uniref:ABC transporter n=1 Tax=Propionibacterium australiense TaxID=119981 RepID=A0A383SAJ9_9ACTN|nr:GTPase [Propionibacterium australiense]RLP06421.1 ABC transporter [Propionibacterium australiense]RLP06828.1 ABC transporter [Propionibacterium australiense]SYZ34444.1 GTP binding domain [Propionibacterium australiense]VEH90029.1 Predicted GTPase [Propionibacterium australiense]